AAHRATARSAARAHGGDPSRGGRRISPAARVQQSPYRKSVSRFCVHQVLSEPRQYSRSAGGAIALEKDFVRTGAQPKPASAAPFQNLSALYAHQQARQGGSRLEQVAHGFSKWARQSE